MYLDENSLFQNIMNYQLTITLANACFIDI
jgi:hypothetical protein